MSNLLKTLLFAAFCVVAHGQVVVPPASAPGSPVSGPTGAGPQVPCYLGTVPATWQTLAGCGITGGGATLAANTYTGLQTINPASANTQLLVFGGLASQGFNSGLSSQRAVSGASLFYDNIHDENTFTSSGGTGGYASFDADATIGSSTLLNHMVGFQDRQTFNGSGGISAIIGFDFLDVLNAPSTSVIGFHAYDLSGSGSNASYTAFACDAFTFSSVSYCFYSAGTSPNYLGGSLQVQGALTMNGGGAMTGTITGSPTLSGNPIFSGVPQFSQFATFGTGSANTNNAQISINGCTVSNVCTEEVIAGSSQTTNPLRQLRNNANAIFEKTWLNGNTANWSLSDVTDSSTVLVNASNGFATIGTTSNTQFILETDGVARMTIAAAGGISVAGAFSIAGILKFGGNNTIASVAGLIGTTCPAVTCTAAYTWAQVTTADGSTGYIPVWK